MYLKEFGFMMSGILLIAYIAVFVLQIVLLTLAIRRKTAKLWISLLLSEVIPMIVAFVLMRYFDSLPGYGFMPGLSYFGEVISSFGAVVLYGVTLFVSGCAFIIVKAAKRKRNTKNSGYVFLAEKDFMWARMLMEVLENNHIPCVSTPDFRQRASAALGMGERQKIYVPAEKLSQASELLDELFSEEPDSEE